jgi:predicted N-acetyltransferase YhbS
VEMRRPCGIAYLDAVTQLLHTVRGAGLEAGLWEAADLHWWYPRDQHPQPDAATIWYEGDQPVSATVFTRWGTDLCGADVLGDHNLDAAWGEIDRGLEAMPEANVDMAIAVRDTSLIKRAQAHGFVEPGERLGIGRATATDRRPTTRIPAGFRVVDRPQLPGRHPLSVRNGEDVERLLHDCSLYDPTCDLSVVTDSGAVAGYALFWPDPATGVGLVEPVRVEDAYAGQGLATALVQAGLERLSQRGCRHFKVIFGLDNPARARLYSRAGFVQHAEAMILRRPKRP